MQEPADGAAAAQGGRFVHLDVTSAYSLLRSPATPRDYAQAAAALAGARARREGETPVVDPARPAIALADYGLHSAVKMAVACREAGVEHICGLRVRVAPERGFRVWDERVGELVLLAMDEAGWLNLVALTNLGHVAGWSPLGPRVDWRDLAAHGAGLVCLTGPPGAGMLSPYAERGAEAVGPAAEVAAALAEIYPGRLYVELAYHGHQLDKLVNRALVKVAERLDLPVVATNAVRFATPRQALAATVLGGIGNGRRMRGVVGPAGRADVPTITLDAARAQAYLKSARAMRALFAGLPAALEATEEIARRCAFRLPLAAPDQPRYGPRYFSGAAPAGGEDAGLAALARDGLAARHRGRGAVPGPEADARLDHELRLIAEQGVAGLLLAAHDVGLYCRERGIGVAARGSATCSLVCWALGLVELNPLEQGLAPDTFVYPGRPDPPDVDLEVAAPYSDAVREHVLRRAGRGAGPNGLPRVTALRLGTSVSLGARQAVRDVGAAIGLEPSRVNALARLVPVLSSPGAIEEVVARTPELGTGGLSPNAEPYNTVVTVAGAIESLPRRFGAHPTGLHVVPGDDPGVLAWLPAQWVGAEQLTDRFRPAPRFPALGEPAAEEPSPLAHPGEAVALEPVAAEPAGEEPPEGDAAAPAVLNDRPALVAQWDRQDFAALGLTKLDVSPSTALLGEGGPADADPDTQLAAWRLIAAGETLCVPHLETIGVRMLLKRAAEAHRDHGAGGLAVESVEGLAQLLALWRPGAYGSEREQAYLAVRYGRERPIYPHPSMAAVLDPTHGQVLYEEQLAALASLVGLKRAWAEAHRRAVRDGDGQTRFALERRLRQAAAGAGWSVDQSDALLVLLGDHGGYLYRHGHALAQAHNALRQACRKVDRAARARFFADALNEGGSAAYGLGIAVEEARKAKVRILPPCVNRSEDRFVVEGADALRVPLAAVRGVSPRVAQHVLAARTTFGEFASLLDFLRKVDRRIVTRQDLLVLIKVGALGFTGMSRTQLTIAHEYYLAAVDLIRAADRDPRQLAAVPEDETAGMARFAEADEWPPEVLAAYDLAHLGFYVSAPLETERHAETLARHNVVPVAELGDYPDKAEAAAGALITALRVRMTKKGEPMAWLTLADGTGAIECAVFPASYARCAAVLREGAFVVARGRMAHEETGPRLFVDEVEALGGAGARVGALAVAVEERRRPRSA